MIFQVVYVHVTANADAVPDSFEIDRIKWCQELPRAVTLASLLSGVRGGEAEVTSVACVPFMLHYDDSDGLQFLQDYYMNSSGGK